jgi:hypothetical protein
MGRKERKCQTSGALFDMSAHARGGHGGSSCHYNCGWNMLLALCAFILFGGVWAIIKGAWKDGGFIWGSLAIAFGGGVAVKNAAYRASGNRRRDHRRSGYVCSVDLEREKSVTQLEADWRVHCWLSTIVRRNRPT